MGDEVVFLDGGLSTELVLQGCLINDDPLWSARLLHTDPSAIVQSHKSYLSVGCDIITTASYQASIDGFQKHLGKSYEESAELIKSSVTLAKQARKEFLEESKSGRNISIAGSVGPYAIALADGSEYSGDYCDTMSHEDLVEWHRPRMKFLLDAGVDYLAFETIPAAKEGEALMKLLHEFPEAKAWLSFSSKSQQKTCHNEEIGKTVLNCMKIAPSNQLVAVGVNCCPPCNVSHLLKDIIKQVGDFRLIAYPNSGEKWISKIGWTGIPEKHVSKYVESWTKLSTKLIVGGCCQTGAKDISHIVSTLKKK